MKFVEVTGKEKYKVMDLTTNGEAYFEEKLEAYRHMTILRRLGRTYRLEIREGL